MKKKTIMIACGVALVAIFAFGIIPVAAAGGSGQTTPAAQQVNISQIEAKLVSIQDGAKVDALLAQAVAGGKINIDQASQIKAYWTANHIKV